ncbi:MAG: hypothetical protein NXH91_07945 [Phyllobacteriaceae bacterium]|nr:hypothetical protein [Phyllobacteriaceae bacterium]
MAPEAREEPKRPGDSRRFARAARHSSRVRLLRWLVPASAVVAFVAVAGVMALSRIVLPGIDVDLASSAIVDGKLVIADPRLDGFTPDQRAYSVSARSATQEIGADPLTLHELRADVEMEDGSTAFLSAETGVFNPAENRLVLGDRALIETTSGITAVFSDAEVDLATGNLVVRQRVQIDQPGTRITADRLTAEDSGRRLVFENNVNVVIEPTAITASAATETPQ